MRRAQREKARGGWAANPAAQMRAYIPASPAEAAAFAGGPLLLPAAQPGLGFERILQWYNLHGAFQTASYWTLGTTGTLVLEQVHRLSPPPAVEGRVGEAVALAAGRTALLHVANAADGATALTLIAPLPAERWLSLSATGMDLATLLTQRQTAYHRVFHSPLPAGLPVELHWALGDRVGQADRTALLHALWAEAETAEIGGASFRVPSRRLLPLYLCHHLEQHLFDTPLTHVWDLAEVLEQAGGDIGTPEFGRLCDRFGVRRGAQAALHLTSACLGLPTPVAPLPAEVSTLLPDVVANLGRHPSTSADEPSPDLVLLTSASTPWRVRGRVLRRQLFPPRLAVADDRAGPIAYAALWRDVLRRFLRLRVMRRFTTPPSLARPRRAARLSAWLR